MNASTNDQPKDPAVPECCDAEMELTQTNQVWMCGKCGLTMDVKVWNTDPPELLEERLDQRPYG